MLRLLSPLFRRIPCLLAAAGLLAACSPTLNWRDVDVGPQTRVQFPCRPEHAERSLVLAGAPMRAGMWVCDAGGLSWSVTVLDVSDPARLTTVLREARLGLATRLQGSEGSSQPVRIAGMTPGPDTKAIVSYLPDADWLPDWMRVEQLVEMFREFYADFDPAKANEMLARLELEPKARLKTLSKGSKEKVQLILAMSRAAKLYLLDEPIGGVDPAARDYILSTILNNYSRDATVILSTHLIGDIEPILDEAVFLKDGRVFAHRNAEELRETEGMSVDAYFREVFKC